MFLQTNRWEGIVEQTIPEFLRIFSERQLLPYLKASPPSSFAKQVAAVLWNNPLQSAYLDARRAPDFNIQTRT